MGNAQSGRSRRRTPPVISLKTTEPVPPTRDFQQPLSAYHCRVNHLKSWFGRHQRYDISPSARTKYSIHALIGRGSFSTVYRVAHKQTGVKYAMKVTRLGDSPSTLISIENELAILTRMHHRNIINVSDCIRTATHVHLVIDLATGGELYDRIVQKGRFTESSAQHCMRQLLHGLSYLHSEGITHRDLKPENLLFTHGDEQGTDRLLITDFGLAHTAPHYERDKLMIDTCGTPEYIAPEVLMRVPYTSKVDLWAVGVICFILLSGLMPFDDEDRCTLYRQIMRGQYTFHPTYWTNVTPLAQHFVQHLLEVEPWQRASADEAISHGWITPTPVERVVAKAQPVKVTLARRQDNLPDVVAAGDCSSIVSHAHTTVRRTRSVRSLARSEHGGQLRISDVAAAVTGDVQLARMVYDRQRRRWRRTEGDRAQSDTGQRDKEKETAPMTSFKEYGFV